ncbi:coniferyl aldehyde dehydrogenase [Paracoccus endophyticus]|uniref:coniferyl aldehyde dehydrogenase n=1 Tax=Paracoccus endophyticus TaxID=2233774 RepID=UPI000DD82980|nr:coniferyl aldehyde dehydrogenase [Paracoccus endophyticus]
MSPLSSDDARTLFDAQHHASRAQATADWPTRLARLDTLDRALRDERAGLTRAIAADFGQRPAAETELAELFPVLDGLAHARRHGRRWMAPRRAGVGLWFRPARALIRPQPLGVVGIVAPWNYPLMLSAGPLTAALVAGNRAIIKLSEHAPQFAERFAALIARHFDPAEVAAVTGGPEVAAAFTALPWDHLLFTGSTAVGRRVMEAAAANLTPVTLELGGKSPALVAPDARLDHAAGRIMAGKMLNAGQTCIAPDYALVPADRADDFIAACRAWVGRHYPRLDRNPDYTTIISAAQFDRLSAWIGDATAQGATLHPLSDAAPDPARRLLPPVIVTDAAGPLAEQEIFGPVLPVVPYASLDEALAVIARHPRPLAFYPFTDDRATRERLLDAVVAGGVTVNDTLLHVAQHDLPFGGVGASGMGAYHGRAGFDRMSHLAPVMVQARWNATALIAPPYGRRFRSLMRAMLR